MKRWAWWWGLGAVLVALAGCKPSIETAPVGSEAGMVYLRDALTGKCVRLDGERDYVHLTVVEPSWCAAVK